MKHNYTNETLYLHFDEISNQGELDKIRLECMQAIIAYAPVGSVAYSRFKNMKELFNTAKDETQVWTVYGHMCVYFYTL